MTWRVGLLIPSSNSVMEVDFYRSLPHDTTLHTTRMYLREDTVDEEERMLDAFALPAAETLRTAGPHIVVFGSTLSDTLRGKDYDHELRDRIGAITGAEPISVAESEHEALRETRAARVAVVSPYRDEINQRIKARIEAEGIEVSALYGMGLSSAEIAAVAPESIYTFVQSHIGPRVPGDALFLPCTNFHAMSALSLLKITYDVPIVTSNLATLQAVKRRLYGLRDRDLLPAAVRKPATT